MLDKKNFKEIKDSGYKYTGTVYGTAAYSSPNSLEPDGASLGIQYLVYPTSNCQVASIANVQALVGRNLLRDIALLRSTNRRPMILIDIKKDYLPLLVGKDAIPEGEIVFQTPYTSTNGSSMIMILFKAAFLEQYEPKPEGEQLKIKLEDDVQAVPLHMLAMNSVLLREYRGPRFPVDWLYRQAQQNSQVQTAYNNTIK